MLRFNNQSQFYKDNAELIRQYDQTRHLLDKRESKLQAPSHSGSSQRHMISKKATAHQVTMSVRDNLKAQVSSLLSKALTKREGNYIYLDFLFDNLAVFERILKETKIKSKEDSYELKQIEELKGFYIENQKTIFDIAHTRSLTREDVLACGPYVNLIYASRHEEAKELYKYDSLLHYVVRLGDVASVQVLLEAGFDVNCYKPGYDYKDKKTLLLIQPRWVSLSPVIILMLQERSFWQEHRLI